MKDFEAFQAAVDSEKSYTSSLSRSLCLVLDEFYQNMHHVGVSAVTGNGLNDFFKAVDACADEYMDTYRFLWSFAVNFLSWWMFDFASKYILSCSVDFAEAVHTCS
jgi:hypothetical protein